MSKQQHLTPIGKGYAASAEGLRVYYEIYGKGEPIVVLAGGFGDISSMAQSIGPLSRERQVIGIDLEGHGRTALRATPMSHERNGDDVAAVLRHLKIVKADVAGYSHGGDAAIRMTIQHPEMVRNLIVISTAAERDGWYPEALKGMEAVSSAQIEQFRQTPLYKRYAAVAPHAEQFPQVLDRMGELMKKDYDWRPEIAKLRVPTLLLFADHDAVSMRHIAEFFALFDGGVRDAGWEGKPRYAPHDSRSCLATPTTILARDRTSRGSSRLTSTNPHRAPRSSRRSRDRPQQDRKLRALDRNHARRSPCRCGRRR